MRDRFTLRTRKSSRIRTRQIAPLASAVSALAVVVPPASARTVTLHYFSKQTSSTFVTPKASPLGRTARRPSGISTTTPTSTTRQPQTPCEAVDSLGSPALHDHRFYGNSATATCDAQIAIGGSMLLANHTQTDVLREQRAGGGPINGGTGIYRHAHGTVTSTSVGNNGDLTIKVTY